MDKKYSIAIISLGAALLVGAGVLVYKNFGAGAGSAQISRIFDGSKNWVEIKPRTVEEKEASRAAVEKEEKTENPKPAKMVSEKTNASAAKTKKPAAASKTAAVKEAAPVIKWCSVKTGDIGAKKIIINEAAWMGSPASYSDEWIELKNISPAAINIAGWQLQNKNKKIAVRFGEGEAVLAGGFYLLERTNDDSAPGAAADKIYSGGLGNSGEALYLFDNNCQLQDSVLAAPKWPAGDNAAKKTMERAPDFLWQTGKNAGGTPKAENSGI